MLARDKNIAVAVQVLVAGSRRCYCGCHPGRPEEDLRTGEARDVVAAVQIVQFGSSEVDYLALTRGVVACRRRFLQQRQERRIHHVRPAVTHSGGESVEGGITIGVGRVENRAAGEAREVSAL